jgi:hypothetical protein
MTALTFAEVPPVTWPEVGFIAAVIVVLVVLGWVLR